MISRDCTKVAVMIGEPTVRTRFGFMGTTVRHNRNEKDIKCYAGEGTRRQHLVGDPLEL